MTAEDVLLITFTAGLPSFNNVFYFHLNVFPQPQDVWLN